MTLTRKELLSLKPEISTIEIPGLGEVCIKTVSELQRSKRLSMMFGTDGKPNLKEQVRSRVYSIVDQLCEKDGKALFAEGEVKDLLALDAAKLDAIAEAIDAFNQSAEKNAQAG